MVHCNVMAMLSFFQHANWITIRLIGKIKTQEGSKKTSRENILRGADVCLYLASSIDSSLF
jgi:hypothetical protein